jgi:hypothetical protein
MKTILLFLALAVSAIAQSFNASVGQSVEFSVTAQGTQPFTYQWFFAPTGTGASSAAAIPGATGQKLVVGPLQPKDAGVYYVRVSNAAGSATSQNLVFTVAPLPPSNPVVTGRVLP